VLDEPALFFPLYLNRRKQALDLDKAWHGIHFLLCGTYGPGSPPLDFLLAGGESLSNCPEDDNHVFSPEQVREIAEALEPITPEFLRLNFDPERLISEDIYPSIGWDASSDFDFTHYLAPYFVHLKEYVTAARQAGQGMAVFYH